MEDSKNQTESSRITDHHAFHVARIMQVVYFMANGADLQTSTREGSFPFPKQIGDKHRSPTKSTSKMLIPTKGR
jgi:hypothetical protein